MSLPASVRADVALRLLRSVGSDEQFEVDTERWLRTEVAAEFDALEADPSRGISIADVKAHFAAKWAADL